MLEVKTEATASKAESIDDITAAQTRDTDDGDIGWSEVVQGNGHDNSCLPTFKWRWRTITSQVPV